MPDPVMHFEIMVERDLDAVRRFYADAFGWEIDAANPMNYGLVRNGGQGIDGGIGSPMNGPSYATFYVETDDLRAKLAKIEALGGTTMMPPIDVPGGGPSIAMFKDPAGIAIGLVQPSADEVASAATGHELSLSRVIDAPRDVVFATWTDPATFGEWWGPHGMTTPVCEMDLRPGGVFRTVMRDPDGNEYPNQGIFLEVAAPERLVFTDAYEPGWKPSAAPFMTAIVEFEELPDRKTRMTGRALHRSASDRVKHEQMGFQDGWGQSFERFAACVAKRAR